ncbi:cytosolic protein [Geobacillus lituanicus]|nr:cytosolic protein [Geobacillus lituanicus]
MFHPLHLKRLVISLIVFVGGLTSLFISGGSLAGAANLVVNPSNDSDLAAVKQKVVHALEARWQLMIDPQVNVKRFYDPSVSEQEESRERAYVRRHYLEPAYRAGFRYSNVEVHPVFESVEINGKMAKVRALVSVEYESVFPGSNESVITKEANIPYSATLIKRDGDWLIVGMNYQDTYSKRGQENVRKVGASGSETPPISIAGGDVVIQGFYIYYSRQGAVNYANRWWNGRNPKYRSFSNDCANFVSQSFYEGGSARQAWAEPYVWWYNTKGTSGTGDDAWTYSWSVAHDQAYHLSRNNETDEHRGTYVSRATDLQLGDSIYYDFDGDGILDHSAIVVEIRNGQPYVNYHTNDTYHRYWDLGAKTTRFLHVTDYYWVN